MALKGEIPGVTKQVGRSLLNMSMSDPISDYLTRIRNGLMAKKRWVDIPSSMIKKEYHLFLKRRVI